MLVSKIKPCMSQYKLLNGETANGSLKQLSFIWWLIFTWITMVILELIDLWVLVSLFQSEGTQGPRDPGTRDIHGLIFETSIRLLA